MKRTRSDELHDSNSDEKMKRLFSPGEKKEAEMKKAHTGRHAEKRLYKDMYAAQ